MQLLLDGQRVDLVRPRGAISPSTSHGGAVTALLHHLDTLRRYAERSGAYIARAPLPSCVLGHTCRERIRLRPDLTPEQELATLIHELAHWLAHRPGGSSLECTLYEYEAEAVETLVFERLGARAGLCAADPLELFYEHPTDGLLAASVSRVRFANERLCEALELDGGGTTRLEPAPQALLEPQAPIDVDAAAGEEVVLEDEAHGVRDFFRLPQPL